MPVARRISPVKCASALSAALLIVGCQSFIAPSETALERLMQPMATSPDSVTLEIFLARIPAEQDQQAEALWGQVDEQIFDANLRRQLVANGLRAGVVGSPPPEELSKLLLLQSEAPAASTGRVITAESATPRVTRRVVQMHRGDQRPIQVSEPRDEATVLIVSEAGRVGGKPLPNVHGVYNLQAEAIPGQRVHLRLTPELDYGEMRMRYSGGEQGIMLKNLAQEREIFERLALNADLAAGELLVLGCLPDDKSSLGGVMHAAGHAGHDERKLVVLRLLEVPPSEILAKK
jgi:hypothetical protein